MIEPKEVIVEGKQFIIHKFPALAGREIMTQYPISDIPKGDEYKVHEALVLKMMAFVGVKIEGASTPLMLTTRELIDNHVTSWSMCIGIERAIAEYNSGFFPDGRPSTFLEDIAQKLISSITKTSTDLSEQSSIVEKLPTTN